MNAQLIITTVELLASVVESLTSSTAVDAAIKWLEAWLPTIISLGGELVTQVQAIIVTLQGSNTLTDAQVATVDALNAQCDAALNAAIANATT